jgi:hypothetical protein
MASKAELELQLNLMEILQEKGMLQEGEALGDFIVMLEISNWAEQTGRTRYANILPPEETPIPIHRVVGLVSVCTDLLQAEDDE